MFTFFEFYYFLLSPNLVSAADEGDVTTISANAIVEGNTIYLGALDAWNDFAGVLNNDIPKFKTGEYGNTYNTADIKTICIGPNPENDYNSSKTFEFNGGVNNINELKAGTTLTMSQGYYLSGSASDQDTNKEWDALLVEDNHGIITNIRIKDLTVTVELNITNEEVTWSQYALICRTNDGTVDNCEVTSSKVVYNNVQVPSNFNIITCAAIFGETHRDNTSNGSVNNCLVFDFECAISPESTNMPENVNISTAQIGIVDTVQKTTNCCAFITNESFLIGTNYPLILYSRYDEQENSVYTDGNIAESNWVFFVSNNDLSYSNIDNCTTAAYVNSSTDENVKKYTSQSDLYELISDFCTQNNNAFDPIKYNYSNDDMWCYDVVNFEDPQTKNEFTINLPKARSNYALSQQYEGKYVVSSTEDYCAMANMLNNLGEDETMEVVLGNIHHEGLMPLYEPIVVPYELTNLTLPKGCSIEGMPEEGMMSFDDNGDVLANPLPTSVLTTTADESYRVNPFFEYIKEGATVKNLNFDLKEVISIDPSNLTNTPTVQDFFFRIQNSNFGIIAGVNEGAIESCAISCAEIMTDYYYALASLGENNENPDNDDIGIGSFAINVPSELARTGNPINIGAAVGTNKGTISNIYNKTTSMTYYCATDGNSEIINYGGLIGYNEGILSDVVCYMLSAENMEEEITNNVFNGHYGLFVAKNSESALAKNAFVMLSINSANEDFVNLVNYGIINTQEAKFDISKLTPDFQWLSDISDIESIRIMFSLTDENGNNNIEYNVNEKYILNDNPEIVKLFSDPAKWRCGYVYYSAETQDEGSTIIYSIPYLSFSDLDVKFENDIAEINISDEDDAAQVVEILSENPTVYSNATINLNADIELENQPMMRQRLNSFALGSKDTPFRGSFNGNNHTLKNLNLSVNSNDLEEIEGADGQKVSTFTDSGIFGVLDKEAEVKNVQFKDAVVHFYNNNPESVKDKKELNIGLLAGTVRGKISGVSISAAVIVDESQLEDGAKVNVYLAGNNDSGTSTAEEQSEISNVAVFISNLDLLYKSAKELDTWYWNNSGVIIDSLTFDNAYSYWANATQYFKNNTEYIKSIVAEATNKQITDAEVVYPTFESFCKWYNALEQDSLPTVTARIREHNFDNMSDFVHVSRNLLGWYHKEAQKDLRTADQKAWADYANTPSEGNHVAVVATQNLCKSPGKGRTHKVCSAPSGGSSNKVLLLNPYAKDVPETEMECTLDEFSSGYAAHWLNYDEKGYSGSYNKMWSQGLLHPIMATDKNKYVVKLEYINEDAEDLGLEYTTYGKVGQTLDLFYTQKPTNVFLDDVELDNTTFAADHLSFVVPETADGKGVVSVHVYFKGTPITDIDADGGIFVSALQNRVIINGAERQQITVSNLQGVAVSSQQAQSDNVEISLPKGVYIVKAGNVTKKVLVE